MQARPPGRNFNACGARASRRDKKDTPGVRTGEVMERTASPSSAVAIAADPFPARYLPACHATDFSASS